VLTAASAVSDFLADFVLRDAQPVKRLQIQPEFRACAKPMPEPHSSKLDPRGLDPKSLQFARGCAFCT
jgi:hypothetical protein